MKNTENNAPKYTSDCFFRTDSYVRSSPISLLIGNVIWSQFFFYRQIVAVQANFARLVHKVGLQTGHRGPSHRFARVKELNAIDVKCVSSLRVRSNLRNVWRVFFFFFWTLTVFSRSINNSACRVTLNVRVLRQVSLRSTRRNCRKWRVLIEIRVFRKRWLVISGIWIDARLWYISTV